MKNTIILSAIYLSGLFFPNITSISKWELVDVFWSSWKKIEIYKNNSEQKWLYKLQSYETNLDSICNLSHDEIIHKNVRDLYIEYWPEQWLELIQKHMLIEINNYRQERNKNNPSKKQLSILALDKDLNIVAQDYATFLFNQNESWHHADGSPTDRVKASNYQVSGLWDLAVRENISYRRKKVYDVINGRKNSPPHNKNLLAYANSRKIGIGYEWGNKGGKRVFTME